MGGRPKRATSGQHAGFTLKDHPGGFITVRVEDRICVAHGEWMSLAAARAMAAAVFELASED